jgi:hypothetical protein
MIYNDGDVNHPVLTRYLYLKSAVKYSLKSAIIEGERKKALFWTYELYKSGFQTEVIEYLFTIYDDAYSKFPLLRKCLQKKYECWKKDYKSHSTFPATMIMNMIIRNHVNKENHRHVLILPFKTEDMERYQTKTITVGKPCKYMRECCEYSAISEKSCSVNLFQQMQTQTQWLYYASYTPIWKMRLKKYEVKICHEKRDVVFMSDDSMEKFMNKFGFEPDEQPLYIQQYCVGIHISQINADP